MSKKMVFLAVIVVVIVLASVGIYLGVHNAKSASTAHTSKPVVAKNTTYHAAVSNSVFVTKSSSALGQYLATPNGAPLYTYSKDTKGVSKCTASCLANWPAYSDTAPAGTGLPLNVGATTRTDNGVAQYTYKDMPLYTYAQDSAGKVTGDGKGGFKLARL